MFLAQARGGVACVRLPTVLLFRLDPMQPQMVQLAAGPTEHLGRAVQLGPDKNGGALLVLPVRVNGDPAFSHAPRLRLEEHEEAAQTYSAVSGGLLSLRQ